MLYINATVLETPSVALISVWDFWTGRNLSEKILISVLFFLFSLSLSLFNSIYLTLTSECGNKQKEEKQAGILGNQDFPASSEITCLLSTFSSTDKVVKSEDWSQHAVVTW